MISSKYDWANAFAAVEAAMINAANKCSAKIAGLEAERNGLTGRGDMAATYQDKIWEKSADGMSLRLRWHCYDQSHAYRALPDMNVLSLQLQQDDKIIRQAEYRFED